MTENASADPKARALAELTRWADTTDQRDPLVAAARRAGATYTEIMSAGRLAKQTVADILTAAGLTAATQAETVRILIPDHPDLYGVLGRAIEFGSWLRHANDPVDGADPWQLPAQLVAQELDAALAAILLHDWHFDVGGDNNTAIMLHHAGIEHMGVYIAEATRKQLGLLVAALDLLTQAEKTPFQERSPEFREIADFVEICRTDEEDNGDASLTAWQKAVRVLAVSVAESPVVENRPTRRYTADAVVRPVMKAIGASPAADTALVLAQIDAAHGQAVTLDVEGFLAWQRLTIEWHTAIYGPQSNDPLNTLQSYSY